ncbi:MAG: hypothetical protein M3R08_01635 [Bacteroidota bacterium]|nr:hypothetical protein [Bacteroidota bacterium]
MFRMRSLLLLFLVLVLNAGYSQDTLLAFYGSAVDVLTKEQLTGLQVTAFDVLDTSDRSNAEIDTEGRFMLGLFEPKDRIVVISADGYVPRRILLEMEGPTEEQWRKGYGLSLEISMYKNVPGLDLGMEEIPAGKGIYDPQLDVFEWDRSYSRSISEQNKDMLKAYKKHTSRDQ